MKTHLRPRRSIAFGLAAACALSLVQSVSAQWMTQRIPLVQGWNAVHLKVNPADTSCSAVFSDSAITEVSWWNRDRLDDGTGSAVTDFCNWYRASGEPNTFSRVVGDQRYLVYSTRAFNLDVIGTPALPKGTIYLGESNLVGVNVPNLAGADAPTYYEYFKPFYNRSPSWYGVTPDNQSVLLGNRVLATNASAAVWLQAAGSGITSFTGPFELSLDRPGDVLSWTSSTDARTLTIKNTSADDRVLRIERSSSLPPPKGHGTCVGDVKLLIESIDWSEGYAKRVYGTLAFPFVTNIASGASFEFRVKPSLAEMPSADGDYMSILEVSDKGTTIDDEVRAAGTCLYRVGVSCSGALAAATKSAVAGLWVGTVVLDKVNRAKMLGSSTPEWDPDALMTAPHPFQFRLLVHVDEKGTVNLLKQVFVAKKAAGADESYLLTDREAAIAFRGYFPNATIRRTASANFPFMVPLTLTGGEFMAPDATLSATFTQEYDDKTNPFVHAFHPQHDNTAFNNQKPSVLGDGDEGVGEYESWGVTRTVTLAFQDEDPSRAANIDWNRTVTGGEYTERIQGLIGQGKPIITKGIFRLSKVNDTPTLTTEVIY